MIINGRPDVKGKFKPKRELPEARVPSFKDVGTPPAGTKQKLTELGPEKFAQWVRKHKPLMLTDTTMRDAHRVAAGDARVRTYDLLAVADAVAHLTPNLFSLEMWGGATFDTSMRFLQEDPWDRLAKLRVKVPNILFQMLLRASNAVGYTNYPDNVVREFVRRAAEQGIDVFRIFDSLNSTENMKVAMETVREKPTPSAKRPSATPATSLTPSATKYSLKYYVSMAKELVKMGTHILAIKDMAGLCKPYAAYALVKALRDEVDVPIHFHTHDTAGVQAGSLLRATDAGVDIVDAALSSMSGTTSQPLERYGRRTCSIRRVIPELDLKSLNRLSNYWEAVREYYYPFEEGMKARTADVYEHEMPGGQYTNLRPSPRACTWKTVGDEIAKTYAVVNQLFGDIVKVTPSSKVVGDLALFMVTNGLTPRWTC